MKLLLDQGLPRGTTSLLSAAGIVAEHVADLGMSRAADHAILDVAKARGSAVVTLDADFHQLLSSSLARSPSVIRIRIEGLKAEALAQILLDVIAKCRDDINAGAAISVDWTRIRVHRLPLP